MSKLTRLPPAPPEKTGWPWDDEPSQLPKTMPNGTTWPRISIVTPSYNQAKFLEETLRSVLLQGYPNLEYMIMDGSSTDGSIDIIKRYEPWLAYWESKKDRGQGHAINKGFTRSTGQIMAWLNSDDVYHRDSLITAARLLADRKKTMLIGSSIITDTPYSLIGKLDCRRPTLEDMAYEVRTIPQPSTFWTRDLWNLAGPINEDLYFALDYELFLRMRMLAEDEIFVDDVLSYARIHPEQKGQRSERNGSTEVFVQQRVEAALLGAKLRREHPFLWLFRIWYRRFKKAFQTKNYSLFRGSLFHRIALRMVLFHQRLAP